MTRTEAAEVLSLPESANIGMMCAAAFRSCIPTITSASSSPHGNLKKGLPAQSGGSAYSACQTLFPGLVIATPQDLPAFSPAPTRGGVQEPAVSPRAGYGEIRAGRSSKAEGESGVFLGL